MGKAGRAKRAAAQGRIAGTSGGYRQTPARMTAPHPTQKLKPKPTPRKRADRSDALTGEPLHAGTSRLWMRDYDTARELYRGEPIPYALHARQMESGPGGGSAASADYLGAHVLSSAALRYFAHAVVSASQSIDGLHAWWLDGYVVGRLSLRFDERMILSAAAYERGMDAREIARVYRVPIKRVIGWSHRIQLAARVYFREYGSGPRSRRSTVSRPAPVPIPTPSGSVYRPEPTGSLMEYAEPA